MHGAAKGCVEGFGGGVAFPGVEGDVVATCRPGEAAHVFEQGGADVAAAGAGIHADIVHIAGGEGTEAAAVLPPEGAEGVSKHGPGLFIDKDGSLRVGEKGQEFLVGVFLAGGAE